MKLNDSVLEDNLMANDRIDASIKGEIVFARILVPFMLGIMVFYQTTESSLIYLVAVAGIVVFSFLLFLNIFYKKLSIYRFKGFVALLWYILFFLFGGFLCVLNKQCLDVHYFGNNHPDFLKITVNDEPQLKSGILRFKGNVTRSYLYKKNGSLKINIVNGRLMAAIKVDTSKSVDLNYGDQLIIPAKFTEITPPYNPSEFDYKSWLSAQNIYHQTFLKQQQLRKLHNNSGNSLIAFALTLRAEQIQFYRKLLKDNDALAVASTLILGYRADLSQETLSTYSRTGTIHALSVSGMHVGLIYLVLNWVLQFLDRGRFLKILKVALIFVLIWFYALLTGFSPSVLRSVIMLSVFIIAKSFNRHSNGYNIMSFAAFSLLVYDPFLIWDVGFQLSFLAVLGLIYLQPKIQGWWSPQNKWINKLWGMVAMSLAAQLMTFPLSVYYFHQFPVYFLISNLFITLPIALLMYIGIIILLGRFEFLAGVFEWLIKFTNAGLNWIADLPFSSMSGIWISKTELMMLSLALMLLTFAFAGFKKQTLFASLFCFAALQSCLSYDKLLAARQRKIIVFNLRKNYATAFISANHAILVTNLNPDDKAFRYFVKPALDQHKIDHILCVDGAKNTLAGHFKLTDSEVSFYNYRIDKFLLQHYSLGASKAQIEDLNNGQ